MTLEEAKAELRRRATFACDRCRAGGSPMEPRPGVIGTPGRIYHPAMVEWVRARERGGTPTKPDVPETIECPVCLGTGTRFDADCFDGRLLVLIETYLRDP